ncbi:MAG: ArsC/Spx/MgsR family protein [candidate division Zixibacteria bacterium]
MAHKRAIYLTYGSDEGCAETRKFLEESGVVLNIRDLEKSPMSAYELMGILGHLDAKHFINPLSESFAKHNLGERIPPREQLVELIAQDITLLKRPIIKTARLLTVGCDKDKISEMLRLSGEPSPREFSGNIRRHQNGSNRGFSKRSSSTNR